MLRVWDEVPHKQVLKRQPVLHSNSCYTPLMTHKENQKARKALNFIIPLLNIYKFDWVITGGFACYVYGVDRLLTDIDIDIDTSKDSPEFRNFLKDVKPHISQDLINYVDENYNNYNLELNIEGQVLDMCTMDELLVYNPKVSVFSKYYKDGFPEVENVEFEGFTLPLLSKEAIIANNKGLISQDKWRQRDIKALEKMLF